MIFKLPQTKVGRKSLVESIFRYSLLILLLGCLIAISLGPTWDILMKVLVCGFIGCVLIITVYFVMGLIDKWIDAGK